MKPDARYHDTRHEYFLTLLAMSDLTQVALAKRIGICPRAMRYYVAGERVAPYPVQFAIESLVAVDRWSSGDEAAPLAGVSPA